jgi:hypothetical protein
VRPWEQLLQKPSLQRAGDLQDMEAIGGLGLAKRGQALPGHRCPVSKDFAGKGSALRSRNSGKLASVSKSSPVKKLLGLGLAAVSFKQAHSEMMLLGVGNLPNQRPDLAVFHSKAGQHLIGRWTLVLTRLVNK